MLENIRCLDDRPHHAHDIVVTLRYPCSGPIECGNYYKHEPHQIEKLIDARCPGVGTSLF